MHPPDPKQLERLRRRFKRISNRLSRSTLRSLADPDTWLSDEDLDPKLWRAGEYFLGFYSARGIENALEAYGIFERLRAMGWSAFRIELDLRDQTDQRLRLFADGHGQRNALLAELIAHEGELCLPPLEDKTPQQANDRDRASGPFDVVVLEWMLLQAPGTPFTPDRPRLPGQRWPGLGIGAEVVELIYRMGLRLEKQAVIAFPAYYHNAVLYRVRFNFVCPEDEGRLAAYRRDLAELSLAEASWAFELGCVRDRDTGQTVHWRGPETCMPLDSRLARRFTDPRYLERVRNTAAACHVVVDKSLLAERMAQEQAEFERRSALEDPPPATLPPAGATTPDDER